MWTFRMRNAWTLSGGPAGGWLLTPWRAGVRRPIGLGFGLVGLGNARVDGFFPEHFGTCLLGIVGAVVGFWIAVVHAPRVLRPSQHGIRAATYELLTGSPDRWAANGG